MLDKTSVSERVGTLTPVSMADGLAVCEETGDTVSVTESEESCELDNKSKRVGETNGVSVSETLVTGLSVQEKTEA